LSVITRENPTGAIDLPVPSGQQKKILISEGLPPLAHTRTPRRISDSVYTVLVEAIRDLDLLPGTSISEPTVAEWLQVSRSPVREAIARVVDLGLVTVVPQVGSYVAPISVREVSEAVFIRSALETSAFKRAIQDGTPDTTSIQHFVTLNKAAGERDDVHAFFDTDEKLHETVFELGGVGRIWDVVRRTKIQLDRLRRLSLPRVMSHSQLAEDHQMIVDCLRTRNEKAGVEVIERHAQKILFTIEEHRELFPDYFAD
jgi:DNA-binding GntR family transcriptional regulator